MTKQPPDKNMPGTPRHNYDNLPTPTLLRAARDTYRKTIHEGLVDGGFDDLPRNGGYVLGGIVNRGASPASIIQALGVTKQAASQLIDTLCLRGYLERIPDTVDRRRMTLEPTERGRAAAAAVIASVDAVDHELVKILSPADLATFRTGLVALIAIGVAKEKTP